jgi:hypothetical protein
MRLPRRVHSSLHGVFAFLAFASFAIPLCAQTSATSPDPLPPKWGEAVTALAEKIAAGSAPARRISLEVKNLSSLRSEELDEIQRGLKADLQLLHLHISPATASDAQIRLTISEGTAGRVLVVEIRRGKERQVAILPAPNEPVSQEVSQPETISLAAKLVWKQLNPFLDFALYESLPDSNSRLLILDAERVVYYDFSNEQWNKLRALHIPHANPSIRHMQGRIDLAKNEIRLSDAVCTGSLATPTQIDCAAKEGAFSWGVGSGVPGHEESLAAPLSQKCGGSQVVLVSGNGDWTEPDTLQGFEQKGNNTPPIPTGNILSFDGPILALGENGAGVVARAVIHNLKTGKYEAYLVTATCNR